MVNIFLVLFKLYAMKMYGGVDAWLHTSLVEALDGGVTPLKEHLISIV
jgi:hypothetical protein